MIPNKIRELADEFRSVMAGRNNLLDTILPPLLFALLNSVGGLSVAVWGSLITAVLLAGVRLWRGESWAYALGGVGGVLIALLVVRLSGRAEGFFVPTLITGLGTAVIAVISVLVKRPMVAWTSYLTRRWPWNWYWHPQVRPAYSEVTWLWAFFFAVRTGLQWIVLVETAVETIAWVNLLTGWPTIIVLLIVSYLYGTWRLRHLGGPSVAEFKKNLPPPWTSQQQGF